MYGKLTKNEAKPNGKQFAADHDQKQDVKLCSSLYSDILISSIQQSKSVDVCTKFAMIGQESFVGLVQAFKTIEKLKFHNYQVEFHFGEDNMVYNGSEKFLMKLVQFALPYVKCIEFAPFVGEWFNVVFDILSKESKQKRLEIHRLPVVNDNVKEALTNMVDIGVLIEFNDIEVSVVSVLPPCHFECLTIEVDPDTKPNVKWHFLKYLDCTFRKLTLLEFDFSLINENVQYSWRLPDDFIVGYVQEICFSSAMIVPDDCTIELLNSIKRVFPNVHTLTIDLFPVREYHRGEFEDYIVQIKEAIDQAPQESIHILFKTYAVRDETKLIEFFDGKKIDENIFEWKMESNGKKTIKLQIADRKKAYFPRNDSSDDLSDDSSFDDADFPDH